MSAIAAGNRGRALRVASCTLWAPACTIEFYRQHYLPALRSSQLERLALFTLTEKAERDDHCANIYHKSLLYLVSNAFEEVLRKPWFGATDGVPLLGMEKFVNKLADRDRPKEVVLSPNAVAEGRPGAARSTTHGDFDDDSATLKATLARILGEATAKSEFAHHRSEAAQRRQRQAIMQQTRTF